MWRPAALDRKDQRWFVLQARMKPGVMLRDVPADIDPIAHGLAQANPKDYPEKFNISAQTYVNDVVGHFRNTLYTLAAAVALLLLIACTNENASAVARTAGSSAVLSPGEI